MKWIKIAALFIASLMLSACDDGPKVTGDSNSPEYAATVFFYTLYEQKDLNKAAEMASPKLARIMRSYGTASQFARNLLNMQFDTVTIEVDRTSRSVRKRYGDKATINLIFSGQHLGNKVDDFRSVVLVKRKGTWFIDRIKADPYAR